MLKYKDVLQELGIRLIEEKEPKCNLKIVNSKNSKKMEIKLKNLREIKKDENSLIFLLYRDGFFILKILFHSSEKIQNIHKNGGYRV